MTSETAARQPKGLPIGGQFAATVHREPDVALAPTLEDFSFDHEDSPFDGERDGELTVDEEAAARHREAMSPIDTPVIWTHPLTGEKVLGRSLGEVDKGLFAFQVPAEGGFIPVAPGQLELAPPTPPRAPVKFTETQRRIRGHNFFAPKAVMAKVPPLGATEDIPFEDKKIHLHYFTGGADWYLTEMDQSTGKAFGFLNPSGNGGHWGYVDLPDLEAVNVGGYRVVERDCHFSQGNLAHATRYR